VGVSVFRVSVAQSANGCFVIRCLAFLAFLLYAGRACPLSGGLPAISADAFGINPAWISPSYTNRQTTGAPRVKVGDLVTGRGARFSESNRGDLPWAREALSIPFRG
jgi:hypothetical protein